MDIEGEAKPRPPLQTRMKMLWDAEHLYIAAEMEEPHVWATLTERDSVIFHDNDFEAFIDPDGDSHHYVELEINALNTTWDLLLPKPYKDGGMPLTGWRLKGLRTAVRVDGSLNDPSDVDKGWSVEIAIPWSSLKEVTRKTCPPEIGDQWRINFSRVEWDVEIVDGVYKKIPERPEHNWVWSQQGVIDMHRPERWGYLQFCGAASEPCELREDPSWPARELLHRIYYAQREFREKHGAWAKTLDELGMDLDSARSTSSGQARSTGSGHACEAVLYATPSLFEASTTVVYPDGTRHEWHIANDALVWEQT